jgi:acyl-coenzyme A synthetase/AMP-(fatty) acid ligase
VRAAKSPQTIAVIIACMMAGRPCLLPSTRLGQDSLGALLDRAGCGGLLTASAAGPAGIDVQYSAHPAVAEGEDSEPADPAADACLMLTTSGSTGLPKIVPLSASAIGRFTAWATTQFGLSPVTTVLNYAPLNFDLCLLDIWATLAAGGTAVLVAEDRATDGRYLAEYVRGQEVSVIQSVPMLYRLLADSHTGGPFQHVKHVITTGDKTPARLLSELPGLFPSAQLYNLYGCTETNDSFLHEVTESDLLLGGLPIGRPLPGVDALVTDADGTILDGPADGELLVRTPFQTAGYAGRGAAEARFVDIDGGTPFFRSGDLVHRDAAGIYSLLSRNDFQVKVRGTLVNLAEIEHVFLSHDHVVDAAVVALPDSGGEARLHAMVRSAGPGLIDSLVLRDHCKGLLTRAAIPSTIKLVDYPLPTTPTGKVDRQAISQTLRSRS